MPDSNNFIVEPGKRGEGAFVARHEDQKRWWTSWTSAEEALKAAQTAAQVEADQTVKTVIIFDRTGEKQTEVKVEPRPEAERIADEQARTAEIQEAAGQPAGHTGVTDEHIKGGLRGGKPGE